MNKTEAEKFKINAEGLSLCILYEVQKLFDQGHKTLNPGLIYFGSEMLKTIDKDELIEGFIQNSHTCWDKIKNRDDLFFIDHASVIFQKLPGDSVTIFKDLYLSDHLSGTFKTCMWDYFDALVKISIKYVYKNPEKFNVNLPHHIESWQIKI